MAPGGRRGARATGRETLERVRREIARGWPAGLTVLTGSDLFHLDRAQRELIGALVPPDSPFALTVFGDEPVALSAVVAAARSAGMFSERRVVLVRELAAVEGTPEPLEAFAREPPRASFLIVRAPEIDRRRKLHQALVQLGRELAFEPMAEGLTSADVTNAARDKGVALEPKAAELLAEICHGDAYRLDAELEKIRLWRGAAAARPLDAAGLREIAVGSAALSGWEVSSALLARDRGAALAALRKLLDAGEEPLRLLGGLAHRARSMLVARALMSRGLPAGEAARAARIWGDPPALVAAGLARWGLDELLEAPSVLLEADRALKSRSLPPEAVLGSALERLLPAQAEAGRGGR